MITNAFVGMQKLFVPEATTLSFKIGSVVSKTDGFLGVKNTVSGTLTRIFGNNAMVGDTVIYKDRQLLGVIGSDNTKIIDIE